MEHVYLREVKSMSLGEYQFLADAIFWFTWCETDSLQKLLTLSSQPHIRGVFNKFPDFFCTGI